MKRELPVPLTAEEKSEAEGKIAVLVVERDAIQTELDALGAKHRKRLREIKKEESRLARERTTGTKLAQVEVEEVKNFETNTVKIVRKDTGAQIEERAMTAKEREQLTLNEVGDDGRTKKKIKREKPT